MWCSQPPKNTFEKLNSCIAFQNSRLLYLKYSTDLVVRKVSAFHILDHEILWSTACCCIPTIWLARSSSTPALTSLWTKSCLSLPLALSQWFVGVLPHILPALCAAAEIPPGPLPPVPSTSFQSLPRCQTFGFLDSLYRSTSLARVTMNSNLLTLRVMLLRLLGNSSHLRR